MMFFKSKKQEPKIVPLIDGRGHVTCIPYSLENVKAVGVVLGLKDYNYKGSHYKISQKHRERIKHRCVLVTTHHIDMVIAGIIKPKV